MVDAFCGGFTIASGGLGLRMWPCLQLDKALQDYNRMREREAAEQGGATARKAAHGAASRRKSALPVSAQEVLVCARWACCRGRCLTF